MQLVFHGCSTFAWGWGGAVLCQFWSDVVSYHFSSAKASAPGCQPFVATLNGHCEGRELGYDDAAVLSHADVMSSTTSQSRCGMDSCDT
jgi:hypothetical protein